MPGQLISYVPERVLYLYASGIFTAAEFEQTDEAGWRCGYGSMPRHAVAPVLAFRLWTPWPYASVPIAASTATKSLHTWRRGVNVPWAGSRASSSIWSSMNTAKSALSRSRRGMSMTAGRCRSWSKRCLANFSVIKAISHNPSSRPC